MIVIYTNLKRWEASGLLGLFGLALQGKATEPLLGVTFETAGRVAGKEALAVQDILLSHEENFIDELAGLDLGEVEDIFLVLHQPKNILAFRRLAEKYKEKRVFFSFEKNRNGSAVELLKILSEHRRQNDRQAYQKAIGEYCSRFQANALRYLTEKVSNDEKLYGAEKWAFSSPDGIPYLWRRLFEISPQARELIQQHEKSASSRERMELHLQIHNCLARDMKKEGF